MRRLHQAVVFVAVLLLVGLAACVPASPTVAPVNPTAVVTKPPTLVEPATVAVTAVPTTAPGPTLLDWLQEQGRFQILLEALERAQLTDIVASDEIRTLFAPTDDAFGRLPETTLTKLFDQPDLLKQVLVYHMSPEFVSIEAFAADGASQIEAGRTYEQPVPTLFGDTATAALWQEWAKINHAYIIEADKQVDDQIVQVIDAVLTAVALPEAQDPPDNLNPETETWIPYAPGEALPIGDAELVPGDPVIRGGVAELEEQLKERGTVINIARAVRLGEQDETTHLAPVGPESVPNRDELRRLAQADGYDIGVLVVEGETTMPGGPGPYIQRLVLDPSEAGDQWYVQLVNSSGQSAEQLEVAYDPDTLVAIIPTAAIFYGTRWCKDCTTSGCFCHRCSWWEVLAEQDWPTRAACQVR